MKPSLRIFSSCFLIFLLIACAKEPDLPSTSTYYFTNTTIAPLTIDVYGSRADYNACRNRISQYAIDIGATLPIRLEALKTYWIDWYSAGYSISNWKDSLEVVSNEISYPTPAIAVAVEDDHYQIRCSANDTSRSILLNGNDTCSRWQATITNDPTDSLNGTYVFIFRRDFTGQFTQTAALGGSRTVPFSYHIFSNGFQGGAGDFFLEMFDYYNSQNKLCDLTWNPFRGNRDSMFVSFAVASPFSSYLLRRQ